MKKVLFSLLLASVLLLSLGSPAQAAGGQPPVGGCQSPFMLHEFHDEHHHDHHVGLATDLNGDGMICVFEHPISGYHVHKDNVVR